jgi:predicted nucleotidyltransferase
VPFARGKLLDDATIAAARQRILTRIADYFSNRSGVLGLFLCGSIAEETADAASDIDFRVVVTPESYDEFCSMRDEAPESWGELLFNSGTMSNSMRVSHFRPFVKVDVFYYRPADLRPSPWYALPVTVLLDRDHTIAQVVKQSVGMTFTATAQQVNEAINQALACGHEILRRVHRGELGYAHHILDELRLLLITHDEFLHGRPPLGFAHFEELCADPLLLNAIRETYRHYDSDAVLESMQSLAHELNRQLTQLNNAFDLGRSPSRDAASFRPLFELGRDEPQ